MIEVDGLVRARGARASLCVVRDGRVLIDQSCGGPPDGLFWIFSASKPFTALLVHRLAVAGVLDLDAPVARYWPEFAGGGKDAVTIRHVLAHRSRRCARRSSVRWGFPTPTWGCRTACGDGTCRSAATASEAR